ncbi:MAG: hypothetical protein JSS79_07685 [Bacteroidetes bacterium]|nr:hypothetical protein [Bacteroidota bacterium]
MKIIDESDVNWVSLKLILLILVHLSLTCAAQVEQLVDSRDGKTYRLTKIGSKVWMAQNLSYEDSVLTFNCKAYTSPTKCQNYGTLYTWQTAQKACPNGWHLPSKDEFDALLLMTQDKGNSYTSLVKGGDSGYDVQLTGYLAFSPRKDKYIEVDSAASFWSSQDTWITSLQKVVLGSSSKSLGYCLQFWKTGKAYTTAHDKRTAIAVRCVKD